MYLPKTVLISGIPRILEWEGSGAAGAEGCGVWGGVSPSPLGEGFGEGPVPLGLPRKFFVFFVENTIV